MIKFSLYVYSIVVVILISCKTGNKDNQTEEYMKRKVPLINYGVLSFFPHDTNSFTEGLFVYNGRIFGSTGSPEELPSTKSQFGIFDRLTGKIEAKVILDKTKYFGEGIALLGDKIYQLTYRSNIGFVYDAKSFQKVNEFKFFSKEGWGLSTDGKDLLMSDGSNKLTFLSPVDFSIQKTLNVFDLNGQVENLNELEFINGFIYAYVFTTTKIVKINPTNGEVVAQLDFASLFSDSKHIYPGSLEMNGIAYDTNTKIYL